MYLLSSENKDEGESKGNSDPKQARPFSPYGVVERSTDHATNKVAKHVDANYPWYICESVDAEPGGAILEVEPGGAIFEVDPRGDCGVLGGRRITDDFWKNNRPHDTGTVYEAPEGDSEDHQDLGHVTRVTTGFFSELMFRSIFE